MFKLLEHEFIILFSIHPRMGVEIKKVKYSVAVAWLIMMYGGSTGFVAAHVMVMNVEIRVQNISCESGRKVIGRRWAVCVSGAVSRIIIDITRARAPPSLFGIDRRMP